jgi:integrase
MEFRKERGLKQLPDGSWQWSFKDGTGKYRRHKARTKGEARAYLEKARTQKREGRFMEKRKENKTKFEEAVKGFLEWSETNTRSSTHSRDKWAVRQWLRSPLLAGKALPTITAGDVERFKQQLLKLPKKGRGSLTELSNGKWIYSWCAGGKNYRHVAKTKEEARAKLEKAVGKPTEETISRRSVDICVARLKRMFNLSVDWGLMPTNPAARVRLFREDRRRVRYLTEEEETGLLDACSLQLRRVVLFALHTGMRRGEILGLRWQDVDSKNGVAVIPAEKAKGKRTRFIPLNSVALAVLDEMPASLDRTALVFKNSAGNEWDRLRKHWEYAVFAAGLEDFRFHDLRHTYASRLVMAGIDLAVLRELLGHRDFEMTLRYAHLAPSRLKAAVTVLEPKLQLSCNPSSTGTEGAGAPVSQAHDG